MILATILSSLLAAAVWQRLPDMPQAKEQLGFEAMGDRVYAVGGICDGNETNTCFAYDLMAGLLGAHSLHVAGDPEPVPASGGRSPLPDRRL